MPPPSPRILLTDNGQLSRDWPFVRERFETRLRERADVVYVHVREQPLAGVDWSAVDGVALFGGDLSDAILDSAPRLRVAGGVTDVRGPSCFAALSARQIPFIEGTAAWGQSVAECGFGLILCALRKLAHWHRALADDAFDWRYPYGQFCDDPRFVNGEIGTKTVGIIGLGQIGSRVARWCTDFGATVSAYDPYAPASRFADAGAISDDIDAIADRVDILVVAVPPTPSATHLLNAARIGRLRQGAIVVTITRTAAVDVAALRERVLADELLWATDVYDVEPVAAGDPILGRANVVHLPHIAGRTRDANVCLADLLADDFTRVLAGEPPVHALTPRMVQVRTQQQ
jgi:D-3-phosphoglycerate dehydrogenase